MAAAAVVAAAVAVTAAVAAAAVAGSPATLVLCHCGAGLQPRPRVGVQGLAACLADVRFGSIVLKKSKSFDQEFFSEVESERKFAPTISHGAIRSALSRLSIERAVPRVRTD